MQAMRLNKQTESAIFMVVFLVLFGGFIVALVVNPGFRDAELSSHLLILFSGILGAMAQYFFAHKNDFSAKPSSLGDRKEEIDR